MANISEDPDKFVSDSPLPSARTSEVLTILAEECAEVTQRATKAIRFGLDEVQSGQTHTNAERLSMEIGDFLAAVSVLSSKGILDLDLIARNSITKVMKMQKHYQTPPD